MRIGGRSLAPVRDCSARSGEVGDLLDWESRTGMAMGVRPP